MRMRKQIEIVSLSPSDGWAFIKVDKDFYQLKPPYKTIISVSEDDVQKSFLDGFGKCESCFDVLDDAIKYVKTIYIKSKKDIYGSNPDANELENILKYAPDFVLYRYLMRAKKLIRAKNYELAEKIAQDLIFSDQVLNNYKLLWTANEIIDECNKKKPKDSFEITPTIELFKCFSNSAFTRKNVAPSSLVEEMSNTFRVTPTI